MVYRAPGSHGGGGDDARRNAQWLAGGLGSAAAGGGGGGISGLIQQAWTRPFKLSAAFGSIAFPCKIRHRNVAWMCPPGQPNRS